MRTKESCKGNAEIETAVVNAEGSTGKAKLICTDGRIISANFVYESLTSGYGTGIDLSGVKYQFIFGDFEINEDALLKAFRKQFKKKSPATKGNEA